MERQVAHMSRLLDDLLDVSRITRGTLELKRAPAELTSVLSAAIETARPVLDAKHHSLSLDFPNEAMRLEADAVRLAQVFSNLLINAAKYTDPHGKIHLSARREDDEIVISVRDNGIGIAPEMGPRLFTMFAQADGRPRQNGGRPWCWSCAGPGYSGASRRQRARRTVKDWGAVANSSCGSP